MISSSHGRNQPRLWNLAIAEGFLRWLMSILLYRFRGHWAFRNIIVECWANEHRRLLACWWGKRYLLQHQMYVPLLRERFRIMTNPVKTIWNPHFKNWIVVRLSEPKFFDCFFLFGLGWVGKASASATREQQTFFEVMIPYRSLGSSLFHYFKNYWWDGLYRHLKWPRKRPFNRI